MELVGHSAAHLLARSKRFELDTRRIAIDAIDHTVRRLNVGQAKACEDFDHLAFENGRVARHLGHGKGLGAPCGSASLAFSLRQR